MSLKRTLLYLPCVVLVIALLTAGGCRKKDTNAPVTGPVNKYGKLIVKVAHQVGGQPLAFGVMSYTNSSGTKYDVSTLKYYISNFTLIREDNSTYNVNNHKLINAADTGSCSFTIDSVENDNYTAVRFYLGVDGAHNVTGAQDGDLDPSFGMFWTWKTGYIFFKHEGSFKNDTGGQTIILYHYGSDSALTSIDIPINKFTVAGDNHVLNLKFDLNTLYSSPNVVDFKNNNIHQSTLSTDNTWILALHDNFKRAFTFDKVQ